MAGEFENKVIGDFTWRVAAKPEEAAGNAQAATAWAHRACRSGHNNKGVAGSVTSISAPDSRQRW